MAKQTELPIEYIIDILAGSKMKTAFVNNCSFEQVIIEKIKKFIEDFQKLCEVEISKEENDVRARVNYYDDLSSTLLRRGCSFVVKKRYTKDSDTRETFSYHVFMKQRATVLKSDFRLTDKSVHESLELAKHDIGMIYPYDELDETTHSWLIGFGHTKVRLTFICLLKSNDIVLAEVKLELKNNRNTDFLKTVYQQLSRVFPEKQYPLINKTHYKTVAEFFSEKEKFTAEALSIYIRNIFMRHDQNAKTPEKAFRKWDGKTPYGVHPTWASMTILHETELPEKLRQLGALALLGHDLLEDTSEKGNMLRFHGFPDISSTLIQEMTFDSFYQETQMIWFKAPEVQLLKLYDKVSNLMDADAWMEKEKLEAYKKYTLELTQAVKKHYPKLNIIKLAEALCQ